MTSRADQPSLGADAAAAARVLMLMTRNQRRGPESYATVVAEELARRGMRITLRSLAPAAPGVPPLPVRPLGTTPLAPTTLARLRSAIADSDVVIAFGSSTLPASVIAGVGVGTPIIYKNIGEPLYWASTPARRVRVRLLMRRVAAVAALTPRSRDEIQRHFGVDRSRIRVIRNARSSSVFRPATEEERRAARAALGLQGDRPAVVIVGALAPEKSVDVAIDAIARAPSQAQLVVVGDGPLRQDLERRAETRAPGRVSFLGARADIQQVLAAADIVLLTSSSEGMPGVLIEAGLSGLPVVATDVGYVGDVVVSGRTGLLVPTGAVDAVAQAIGVALEQRHHLGSAARRRCVKEFDLERVSDAWAELVNDLVPRGVLDV